MTLAVLLLLGMAVAADQPATLLVTVLAGLVAACVVVGVPNGRPARVLVTSMRRRARDAGVPPLCDPDAPGRPRPRAPSV